jgi:hypothetical protein
MSVAEKDVIDFITPYRKDVVKMVRDSLHSNGLRKVLLMKASRQSCDISDLIKNFANLSSLPMTAPRTTILLKHILIHLAIRAVAMKK